MIERTTEKSRGKEATRKKKWERWEAGRREIQKRGIEERHKNNE